MSRRIKRESPGRDRFIDAVLDMLDEGMNVRGLNLRTVARRVGCAHTNAYNYFASYDELLWWSLREALERMVSGANATRSDALQIYIDFALTHPEWYRLVWLVPLPGDPPDDVRDYLPVPGQKLIAWLREYIGTSELEDPMYHSPETGARILHRYIHGELTIYVTGRVSDPPDVFRRELMVNTARLFRALFGRVYIYSA